MNWIALRMLTGDRGKYLGLIFGVTFATHLMSQQVSIFMGILTRTGAYAEAHQVLHESLAATYPSRIDHMILNALYYLGELMVAEICQADPALRDARLRQAAALLTVVTHNPVTWHYFRVKADRLLATLPPEYLPADDDVLSIESVVPGLLGS